MSIPVPRGRGTVVGSAISYSLISVFLLVAVVTVLWSALAFDILAKWPPDVPRKTTQRLSISTSSTSQNFGAAH